MKTTLLSAFLIAGSLFAGSAFAADRQGNADLSASVTLTRAQVKQQVAEAAASGELSVLMNAADYPNDIAKFEAARK